ncbi:MAG: M20/M25/M40 family metallo-hydrolase [Candidatus Melainabacteria bacterium]|nr:M20/M25/M40 family metallo-hydrolase [Candidatus Melainabacteria bacterium]
MPVDSKTELTQYVSDSRQGYEADLKTLVDLAGVSMDPERKAEILRTADCAVSLIKRMGGEAEIVQTNGNPVVIGGFVSDKSAPTVLVYNHLDVQPADADEWKSQPFSMSVDGDTYRGRGSTDDKGPALAVLYAAAYAHKNKIAVNVKFVWELEEEIGSPNFEEFLKQNKEKLACDSVVISDTIWVSRERPAIPYGLRGLQGVLLKLKTGNKDVHSGLTGGLARNPIAELCQLIDQCHDAKTGKVNIPGFYDGAREPSDEEASQFVKSGFSIDGFKKAHELISLRTDDAKDGSLRIWAKPTFEVHGISGGYQGPGVKTIVPYQAEAKISMRLVSDQDPEKVFQAFSKFVKEKAPDVIIEKEGSLKPFLGEFKGPFADAAVGAMKDAFGVEPAFTREGGSIGAVVSMKEVLGKPIVFLGLSLPEHGYHAVNENFDWQQASGGIKMFVAYFGRLAKIK